MYENRCVCLNLDLDCGGCWCGLSFVDESLFSIALSSAGHVQGFRRGFFCRWVLEFVVVM